MLKTLITAWFVILYTTLIPAYAEDESALQIGKWRGELTNLQYRIGEDLQWSQPNVDLTKWKSFDRDILVKYQGVYWLRFDFQIETNGEISTPARFDYKSLAAFDLYFDGQLVAQNGVVGSTENEEIPGLKQGYFILPREIITDGNHVLTFRMSSHHWHQRDALYRPHNKLISLLNISEYYQSFSDRLDRQLAVGFLAVNIFLALYYFILFLANRRHQTHLYTSLLCLSMFVLGTSENLLWIIDVPYHWDYARFWVLVLSVVATVNLLPAVFMRQFDTRYKFICLALFYIYWLACLIWVDKQVIGTWIVLGTFSGALLICIDALRRKHNMAWLSIVGILACMIAFSINDNYFYLGFTLLNLSLLTGLTLQDRQQRDAFHQSNLQASQLEAQMLRQNIQPHFLMNSLTTILEWVEDEPDKAGVFIELLADEFRSFNQISQKQWILVEEEIALCKTHMEVMGYRLQKTFNLQLENVDLQRQIPPAIIHTLIENGISHNNYQQENVTFVLRQNLHNNTLTYTVLTPLSSNLQSQQSFSDSGTGTKYIRSRLEQCYSGKWQIESYKQDDYWLTKIIIIS